MILWKFLQTREICNLIFPPTLWLYFSVIVCCWCCFLVFWQSHIYKFHSSFSPKATAFGDWKHLHLAARIAPCSSPSTRLTASTSPDLPWVRELWSWRQMRMRRPLPLKASVGQDVQGGPPEVVVRIQVDGVRLLSVFSTIVSWCSSVSFLG